MFEEKKRREPGLMRIIIVLAVLVGLGYGGLRLYTWYDARGTATVAAEAPERIAEARALIDQGAYAEAIAALGTLSQSLTDERYAPEVLILLAEAKANTGQMNEAVSMARRASLEYSGHPNRPLHAVQYARLLEQSGNFEEAEAIFQQIADTAPPDLGAPALTGLGRAQERAGNLPAARDLYAQAVQDAEWESPAWEKALDALGDANVAMFFGREETPESQVYVVQPGDNLTAIGVKLNTTLGSLTRANGITEESSLQVGQRLKYTPKDFRIVIDRATNRLFVVDSQGIFKAYRVGLGAPGSETVLGSYRIGDKIKDPTWHKPGEGPIPPGDPRNELATRWMQMVPEEEGLPKDLGIHGTLSPETIGYYSSNGCARMLTPEVEELFDIVVRATPVLVVEGVRRDTMLPAAIAAR
jgi:lipoprotein-anchoring transpeptidase ErfK/SrfK/predicted negative regulator of RcsB-dependent stress response